MVSEAQRTSTQAVEESKRPQVATSLQDGLDGFTSKKLHQQGEVREARPQAPPRRGDVEPAAPSRVLYQQRERCNYPSRTPPNDQEARISQSSAAPSAKSGKVSGRPPRAPPPTGYQAVPPAAGYQWLRVAGKWQQERLPRVEDPQRNTKSANRYEELPQYGPEEEEEVDVEDVSKRSGISLKEMLDCHSEGLPPPYNKSEEERDIAHDINIHALETKRP